MAEEAEEQFTTSLRPPIELPYGEAIYNGGGVGFSPGQMTLVSNLFSDSEDFKSFSQLVAGAMASPAAAEAALRPDGGADMDLRFEKNRPTGLAITQPPGTFTVPPGLSPATLLDSPSFLDWFSPGQVLAQVSAEAAQPQPNAQQMSALKESSELSVYEQRSQPLNLDKLDDDGYTWRKYGQKQVKGSEFSRSYYRCSHPNCPVKKKVERSLDGQVTEIIYKGQHNHQPRHGNERGKDCGKTNGGLALQLQQDNEAGQATTEQMSDVSNSEEADDAETDMTAKDEDEPDPKRRSTEIRVSEPVSSHRTVSEPRIIVQTTSEIDLLDDGYKWRKYGQKIVKGNPYPRSYYKCTTQGCNVRKHVERAATDPKAVITAYEGKHNHDVPAARMSSRATTAMQLRPAADMARQQPIARLRLKEQIA